MPLDGPRASLGRNFSLTLTANAVSAAASWLVLVLFAKLGNAETIGVFVLGLAIANPVLTLFGLDLRTVQATDALERHPFGHYRRVRLITIPVALAVIGAAVLAFGSPGTAPVLLLVAGAKAVEAVSDVHHGLFQRHERMDLIARSVVAKAVLSLVLVSLVFLFTRDLALAAGGMLLGSLLVLFGTDVPRAREFRSTAPPPPPRFDAAAGVAIVRAGLPLGAMSALVMLGWNLPRYFVHFYHGQRELGVFGAVTYLMMVSSTVMCAVDSTVTPRLSQLFASRDLAGYRALAGRTVAIAAGSGIVMVSVAALFGREVLALVYNPEIARYQELFVWTMVAAAVSHVASSLRNALTCTRRFTPAAAVTVVSTAALFAACRDLVPRYGSVGAAQACIIAAALQLLGTALLLHRTLGAAKAAQRPAASAPAPAGRAAAGLPLAAPTVARVRVEADGT
jgi:O-antigen/teichoic acid export membrane protein